MMLDYCHYRRDLNFTRLARPVHNYLDLSLFRYADKQ